MSIDTPDFSINVNERDTAIPRFFLKPVKSEFESNAAGRPVFHDKEYIEILVPGDRKTSYEGAVKEEDRQRFPRQYAAFKAGLEVPVDGTPIDQWAAITRSQAEELKFAHIRTVEQLAELPDDALNRSLQMGGFALREKAQRWMAAAKESAPLEQLAAERDDLKATVEALKANLEDLRQKMTNSAVNKETSNG